MSKTIVDGSPVLPDIDRQIQYIKHLRKDVLPRIKNLQTELDMIIAIEQSLMAAKLFGKNGETDPGAFSTLNASAIQILNPVKIKVTAVRVEVLKTILARKGGEFTVSEIYKDISRSRPISKSAVIATIILFKEKRLISESKPVYAGAPKKIGRPETTFIYIK